MGSAAARRLRARRRGTAVLFTGSNYSARPVISPSSPLPARTITGGVTDRSTTVVGSRPQSPPSRMASTSCARRAAISRPGSERLRIPADQQRRAHDRLLELREQQPRHRVRGNAHADGAAARVLQAARGLARGAQEKGVGPGQAGAQHAELPGLQAREPPDLRQIGAHQREMVVAVGLADAPHALERRAVAQMPPQGVAGVGRVGDQPPGAQDLGRPADQARLRIDRVQLQVFSQDGAFAEKTSRVELGRGA